MNILYITNTLLPTALDIFFMQVCVFKVCFMATGGADCYDLHTFSSLFRSHFCFMVMDVLHEG